MNSRIKFWVCALLYIFVSYSFFSGKPIEWVLGLLVGHLFVGMFLIALRHRPLGFGLLNVGCEILSLIVIASLSLIPITLLVVIGIIPKGLFGLDRSFDESFGFVVIGAIFALAIITIPSTLTYFLCRSGLRSFYSDEPTMD